MSKKILINKGYKEKRIAVTEEGKLVEIYIERSLDEESAFGNIFKGRVSDVLPGMDAAFINIGTDRNAFMHASDVAKDQKEPQRIQRLVHQGQEVLVQIKKEAVGTKGARVTTSLTIPGKYIVLLPKGEGVGISRRIVSERSRGRLKEIGDLIKPSGMGMILRTAAKEATADELSEDLAELLQTWQKIEKKASKIKAPSLLYSDKEMAFKIIRNLLGVDIEEIIVDSKSEAEDLKSALAAENFNIPVSLHINKEPLFQSYGIEIEIKKALRQRIWLDCGGFLIFDRTEALSVIDVNTGKYTGKDSLENTVLTTNLQAAKEIARQIRLRNIGGIILIDFIDMERPEDKEQVRQQLIESLKRDRVRSHVFGFTSLGLLEMTRHKASHDLDAILRKKCPICGGTGRAISEDTAAFELLGDLKQQILNSNSVRFLIKAHPAVIAKVYEVIEDPDRFASKLRVRLKFEALSTNRFLDYQIYTDF